MEFKIIQLVCTRVLGTFHIFDYILVLVADVMQLPNSIIYN